MCNYIYIYIFSKMIICDDVPKSNIFRNIVFLLLNYGLISIVKENISWYTYKKFSFGGFEDS